MRERPQDERNRPEVSTDALVGAWLEQIRLRAAYVVVGRMGEGAAVDLPAEGTPTLHYVHAGSCVVGLRSGALRLGAGDLLFMPRGLPRRVHCGAPAHLRGLHQLVRAQDGPVHHFSLGADPVDNLVLGIGTCPSSGGQALRLLPEVSVIRPDQASAGLRAWMASLVVEAREPGLGTASISSRIAEVVLLHAVRDLLSRSGSATPLGRALADPPLCRVLVALEGNLEQRWTVERLARVAGQSRSLFARRFREVLQVAPMAFVTERRMQDATRRLRRGDQVQEVAGAVGYRSVAAFSTAYKRVIGAAPSDVIDGPPRD